MFSSSVPQQRAVCGGDGAGLAGSGTGPPGVQRCGAGSIGEGSSGRMGWVYWCCLDGSGGLVGDEDLVVSMIGLGLVTEGAAVWRALLGHGGF